MDVSKQVSPKKRRTNGTKTSDGNFNGMSVFGSQTKRSGVLVMLLVNVLVERSNVQSTMEPVMPGVFHEEKGGNLDQKVLQGWEVCGNVDIEIVANGLEGKDGNSFDNNMRYDDIEDTFQLFSLSYRFVLNLVFTQQVGGVQNVPRKASAKVNEFVNKKEEQASGKEVIIHP